VNSSLLTTSVLISYALLWLLALGLAVVMIALLRQFGLLFDAVDPVLRFSRSGYGLKLGDVLPSVPLERLGAGVTDLRRLGDPDLFLLVVQPNCGPCEHLLQAVRTELLGGYADGWGVALVVLGDASAAAGIRDRYRPNRELTILADPTLGAVKEWGVTGTPFALAVDSFGRVQRKFSSVTANEVRDALCRPPARQRGPRLFRGETTPMAGELNDRAKEVGRDANVPI
jgi:hypothetical protein